MKLLFFDLETTSLDTSIAEIIEFGCAWTDGHEVGDSWGCLVDVGFSIPSEVTEITGITNAMLRGRGISPDEAFEKFGHMWMSADAVGGHNIKGYDLKVLERFDLPERPWADTLVMSNRYVMRSDCRKHNLSAMASHFGVSLVDAHRAEDDSIASARVYIEMLKRLDMTPEESIDHNTNRCYPIGAVGLDPFESMFYGQPRRYV